jgi:hypothetical protein
LDFQNSDERHRVGHRDFGDRRPRPIEQGPHEFEIGQVSLHDEAVPLGFLPGILRGGSFKVLRLAKEPLDFSKIAHSLYSSYSSLKNFF